MHPLTVFTPILLVGVVREQVALSAKGVSTIEYKGDYGEALGFPSGQGGDDLRVGPTDRGRDGHRGGCLVDDETHSHQYYYNCKFNRQDQTRRNEEERPESSRRPSLMMMSATHGLMRPISHDTMIHHRSDIFTDPDSYIRWRWQ